MTAEQILVSISGLFIIFFIYWFFFEKKDSAVSADGKIEILVDGGYKPSVVKIKKNQETTISILRKDPNTCLEEFVLSDFKIKKYLPLNKKVEFSITPTKVGEFSFHCGMNMFHGKVVVV